MKLSLPLASLLFSAVAIGSAASAAEQDFYVGTYTKKEGSKGIYHFKLDPETGKVSGGELAAETKNPTFLAIKPGGKFLYAAGEIDNFQGKKSGLVSAYAIGEDGKLTLINQQPSGGDGACHVSVDAAGRFAFVANYGGGSFAALPIKEDGSLGASTAFIQNVGTGPDKGRQKEPHGHSIYSMGSFVYACDLGTDHVDIFRLDPANGTLTPNEPPFALVPPGSGPRHLALSGGFAYVLNEMACTVSVLKHDPAAGTLGAPTQNIATLPAGAETKGASTAEIFAHPNGRFIYASNRGNDTIAVFAINSADGSLSLVEHAPVLGRTPRGFNLDPSGRWLVAGHQDSNSMAVFGIDLGTGKLTPTGQKLELGAPVTVEFVK